MSMALVCRGSINMLTTLRDVLVSVCIVVGGYRCPIAMIMWGVGMNLRKCI